MRSAGGYFVGAGKPNFSTLPSVKALFKELDDIHGTEAQPMTHGTRRMLVAIIRDTLPRLYGRKPYLLVRETVDTLNNSVGCLRATESVGAVEGHGLAANDCFILKDLGTGEVSVELKLHDSKTHFDRWINMIGVTKQSKLDVAGAYMDLFKQNGLTLFTGREGGFEYIQPDSWSVKLSLLGQPSGFAARLERALAETARTHKVLYPLVTRLVKYATDAYAATTGGDAHKYVLLTEGAQAASIHSCLMGNLVEWGLGKVGEEINLIPAPLLRATHNAGRVLTPMPYTYGAAYDSQRKLFDLAWTAANPTGDPDPEFDLQGHEVPRFGKHSWRRFGEKVARDSQHIHNMPPEEIDMYAGWDQKEHDHDMQMHYAGQQRSHRVKRRLITSEI